MAYLTQIFWWVLPLLIVDIVASYNCMQFQGKLKNQTWENGKKKPSLGTKFDPFGPNVGPKKFFIDFTSTTC